MSKKAHLDKAIIESAENEFAKFGLDKANMSTIAANAGVTKRTLYKYYENKEKLYEAILTKLIESIGDELDFPFDPKLDLKSQINNLIEIKVRISTYPHTLKVARILLKDQVLNPIKDSILNNQMREGKINLTNWLNKCREHGLVKKEIDLDLVTEMIFALVDGIFVYPIIFGEVDEVKNKDAFKEKIVESVYSLLA